MKLVITFFNGIPVPDITRHLLSTDNHFQVEDGTAHINSYQATTDFKVLSTESGLLFVQSSLIDINKRLIILHAGDRTIELLTHHFSEHNLTCCLNLETTNSILECCLSNIAMSKFKDCYRDLNTVHGSMNNMVFEFCLLEKHVSIDWKNEVTNILKITARVSRHCPKISSMLWTLCNKRLFFHCNRTVTRSAFRSEVPTALAKLILDHHDITPRNFCTT